MPISYWSSDLCSSYLGAGNDQLARRERNRYHARVSRERRRNHGKACPHFATKSVLMLTLPDCSSIEKVLEESLEHLEKENEVIAEANEKLTRMVRFTVIDRKSVVEGKSLSVRVDLGC